MPLVDEKTLHVYEARAPELSTRDASVESPFARYFEIAFPQREGGAPRSRLSAWRP